MNQQVLVQTHTLQASKIEIPKLTLDVAAIEQAARASNWLQSQHQADAFVSLTIEWLRNGQPYLAPDPVVGKVLGRFSAHQLAWNGALTRAMATMTSAYDRECLQQVMEAIGFAGRVSDTLARQSGEQSQRTEQLGRVMAAGSSAPFAYFKRAGRREPLLQCRHTDTGAIPLYLDPQAVLDPIVVKPSAVDRIKSKATNVLQSWRSCRDYVRQAAHNAWYPGLDDDEVDKPA